MWGVQQGGQRSQTYLCVCVCVFVCMCVVGSTQTRQQAGELESCLNSFPGGNLGQVT
jgi:hypothetical protein